LQVVLDSNVFIFAYGDPRKASCERLIAHLIVHATTLRLGISRNILEEVRRNINPQAHKELWVLLNDLGVVVDENWQVPYELGVKYEHLGLKSGDAFIAAYTEWIGADYLITENRDFLHLVHLPFTVIKADPFLKLR